MAGRDKKETIAELFAGRSVFITGGSGFIGKVLIEKLLRSCPAIDKIFILMRPSKGKGVNERVEELVSLPLFSKINRDQRQHLAKITPLVGDVMKLALGLSTEDQAMLTKNVSVVFHCAASIRFDDPLHKALAMNTRGTYELVKLCRKIKQLALLVHVSTTYCNVHKPVIEEKVYPAPADWRQMIKLCNRPDHHLLEVLTSKVLGQYPNTYTFTKALAEHVIVDNSDIPSIIFRPSIVISSVKEPMPGWVDNFNGPIGMFIGAGKGIVRAVLVDPNIRADFVPVDLTVRAMLAVTWHTIRDGLRHGRPTVYNCASRETKSLTQREIIEIGYALADDVPLNNILWVPGGVATAHRWIFYLSVFFLHLIPAFLVDTSLALVGRKPMLMKIQRRVFVANMALEYFLTRQWLFRNQRLIAVDALLRPEDQQDFKYDIREEFNEMDYFKNCMYGGREYLLKEDNKGLPQAKAHYKRMYWIDKTVKIVLLLAFAVLAIKFKLIAWLIEMLS